MKRTYLFVLIIVLVAVLPAQQMMGPPAGKFSFTGVNGVTEIPFELIRNHVILKANLNGVNPIKLVLDTGFPAHGAMLYKTEQIEKLNLKYSGQAMVGGAGGDMKPAEILAGASLSFPGVEFTEQDVIVMPYDESLRRAFSTHDGAIGYSFFSRFVMDFDFEKMILRVIEPDRFIQDAESTEIPLEIIHNTPFITCFPTLEDGTREAVKMALDMGATHALSLDANEDSKLSLPAVTLKRKATGVGGDFYVDQGRIKFFEIGKFKLENVLVSFSDLGMGAMPGAKDNSNLGMDILRRFHLIIDYANSRIFLKPNKNFIQPFETSMSGIRYYRNEKEQLVVEEVTEKSPASEIGLQVEDIITELDSKDITKININKLTDLMKQNGKTLRLTILRNGKKLHKELKLRRLI